MEYMLVMASYLIKLRGETFVTRKITRGMSRIQMELRNAYLGNLDSKEIGSCKRLCTDATMLQQNKLDDL